MIPRMALTVSRLAVGTYVKGVFTEGTTSAIVITASVQSASPHDLESLPEGRRNAKTYRLYTDTRLRLVTMSNPDKVGIFGETYEVNLENAWQNGLINHYKYIVTKIGEP
jgi:hypothetical protein